MKLMIGLGTLFFALVIGIFAFQFWSIPAFVNSDSSEWEHFGAYVGGIIAPIMSFLTLIYLIKSNSDQSRSANDINLDARKQRNLDNLFRMISEFREISKSVEIEIKIVRQGCHVSEKVYGNEAFLYLYKGFRIKYLNLIRGSLIHQPEKFQFELSDNMNDYARQQVIVSMPFGQQCPQDITKLKFPEIFIKAKAEDYLQLNIPEIRDDPFMNMFYDEITEKIDQKMDRNFIQSAFEQTYNEFGYAFGHYFRNLKYILHYTDEHEFEDKQFCFRYLRSVLSSYENVFLYYDCIYYADDAMISIINDNLMLNDLSKQHFQHKNRIIHPITID